MSILDISVSAARSPSATAARRPFRPPGRVAVDGDLTEAEILEQRHSLPLAEDRGILHVDRAWLDTMRLGNPRTPAETLVRDDRDNRA